jgi:hypothetical protein
MESIYNIEQEFYSGDFDEKFADYLLDNGVVVLPEKVYWFNMGGNLTEAKRIDEFFAETEKGYGYQIAYSEIGKTVFLTKEDAEAKLKGETK